MKLFRVIIATEDAEFMEDGGVVAVPVINHVVYVVAPDRRSVATVMREDETLKHYVGVPRIAEELDAEKRHWQVKIGYDMGGACIFVVVPGLTQLDAQCSLLATYREHHAIREMLDNGWYSIAPTPIDTSKPGVW